MLMAAFVQSFAGVAPGQLAAILPPPGASGQTTAPRVTPSLPLQKVIPQKVLARLKSTGNWPNCCVGAVTQNLLSVIAQLAVHPEAGDRALPGIGTSERSSCGTQVLT